MCLSVCRLKIRLTISFTSNINHSNSSSSWSQCFGQWIIYRHMANVNTKSLKLILGFPALATLIELFLPPVILFVNKLISAERERKNQPFVQTHSWYVVVERDQIHMHNFVDVCSFIFNSLQFITRPKNYVETETPIFNSYGNPNAISLYDVLLLL